MNKIGNLTKEEIAERSMNKIIPQETYKFIRAMDAGLCELHENKNAAI